MVADVTRDQGNHIEAPITVTQAQQREFTLKRFGLSDRHLIVFGPLKGAFFSKEFGLHCEKHPPKMKRKKAYPAHEK
jgi:hypothetical protein